MVKKFLLSAAAALIALSLSAKVELPNIIGDNMVLQRESSVALWGKARAKAELSIVPSWNKSKTVVTVGKDGKWSARITTPAAGGPYEIVFSDGEELRVKNILIGEVWYCGGQSNMSMPVRGFGGQRVEGALDAILNANPETPIRMAQSKSHGSVSISEDNDLKWLEHTPDAVASQSAVSYFFAQQLYKSLRVPIGVVAVDWGGSSIETWISREYIERDFAEEFDISYLDKGELPQKPHRKPCCCFNGMVAPLIPFTFKGIIWYQGEGNRERAEQYLRLSKTYVEMMRKLWNNPDMPFYAVQIAPYRYKDPNGIYCPLLQEAQLKAAQQIPHAGLATTLDIGNPNCIHPAQKREVGQRLAALALQYDYGFKGIFARAPEYKDIQIDGSKVTLEFNCFGSYLGPFGEELSGFEIAGQDRVWHRATSAKVCDGKNGKKRYIELTCSAVPEPVAVRYAFHEVAEASIFNNMGIPVGPFRTDDWEE